MCSQLSLWKHEELVLQRPKFHLKQLRAASFWNDTAQHPIYLHVHSLYFVCWHEHEHLWEQLKQTQHPSGNNLIVTKTKWQGRSFLASAAVFGLQINQQDLFGGWCPWKGPRFAVTNPPAGEPTANGMRFWRILLRSNTFQTPSRLLKNDFGVRTRSPWECRAENVPRADGATTYFCPFWSSTFLLSVCPSLPLCEMQWKKNETCSTRVLWKLSKWKRGQDSWGC